MDQIKKKMKLLVCGNFLINKIQKILIIVYLNSRKTQQMTQIKVVFSEDSQMLVNLYFKLIINKQVYLVVRPKIKLIFWVIKVNKN